MKNIFLFICFSVGVIKVALSQETKGKDTITISKSGDLYLRGEKLPMNTFSKIVRLNPGAYAYFKKSRVNTTVGYPIALAGGFVIGYEIGSAIFGKRINWGIMGAGIGGVGLSLPFAIGARRNLIKAIQVYNTSN